MRQPKALNTPGAESAVCINGRFLTQRSSGVQRFARELVKALDEELGSTPVPRTRPWVLLVPPGVSNLPLFKNIVLREVGSGTGHLWDQLMRFHCKASDVLVNLANSGPIFRGRSISIVHDAAVYRTPHNFTRAYRVFHQVLGRLIAVRSRIGTVSEFSRRELADVLRVPAAQIFVVPNSCEHLRAVSPDESVLGRLGLASGRFFLAIGSPAPNKNLAAAIAAFSNLMGGDHQFVIVGALDKAVFGRGLADVPEGVVLAGGVSDEQVIALLRHATALVFPSLYEGFGIPPLEAMLNRCPVLAARIPPVVEVCGDAVLYFDPINPGSITGAMRQAIDEPALLSQLVERGENRAASFSWRHSARLLMQAVDTFP
jgi:glycosyltransferase involved in cell wall biosynthesis